ncbi:putative reverse transcriptase domain-containing protein [Tanacetum coccineum]
MVDMIYDSFGLDSHRLRMKVFSLSLADDAEEWWINEGDEKITTWEELVEKFFCRFYPESYDREDEMLDEGENWELIHSNSYPTLTQHSKTIRKRPDTVRAYVAAPAGGKIYAGNLPKCNRCNLHHHGPCPQKCQRCQRLCHMEKDCRVRLQGAGNDFLQNVTCFGCGEKGHFKDKCPKAGKQQNNGARGRAYVVVENPQQNPNVVTETKTQVCLLCEVILKQIPAFNFFCASFESITAIEKLGKWWDCQLGNYTWGGGDSGGGGDVLPKGL